MFSYIFATPGKGGRTTKGKEMRMGKKEGKENGKQTGKDKARTR